MAAKINYVAMIVIALSPMISYFSIKKEVSIFTTRDFEVIAMWALFLSVICLFFILQNFSRHEAYFTSLFMDGEIIKTDELIDDGNSVPHLEDKYWFISVHQSVVQNIISWVFWLFIITTPIGNYYLYGNTQKVNK